MIRRLQRPYKRLAATAKSSRAKSTSSSTTSPILPYAKRSPTSKPPTTEPSPAPVTKDKAPQPRSSGWKWALWTLNLFIAGHLTTTYLFTIKGCVGPSMLPTINYSGDWVFISKIHPRMKWIKVGDLVSFHNPARRGFYSIKRVIGMPGDFVLRDTPGKGEGTMVRVPPGHCWVVGDNLDGSRDSRMFGALPMALIKGKVLARVWPDPKLYTEALTDPVILNDD